jgi:hypothetical protein
VQERIRVALCGLPTLVDDIVTVLLHDASDVDIVARVELGDDLREDFERAGVDLLIYAIPEGEMRALWDAATAHRPLLAVLNLGVHSRDACLYGLHPTEHLLEAVTRCSLLETLREQLPR